MKHRIVIIGILTLLILSCNSKNKSDLIRNYENKSSEINEVKNYFDKTIPENFKVSIRYKSSNIIKLEIYEKLNDSSENELLFRDNNVNFSDYKEKPQKNSGKKYYGKTNSLELVKKKLNWNNENFKELYQKLESAECIGVSNWKPTEIEYGYNGAGVYSYQIFEKNLTEQEIEKYNDGCNNIFYKDNIVLSYTGGAFGMQCFENY